jgi:hypothetical protein
VKIKYLSNQFSLGEAKIEMKSEIMWDGGGEREITLREQQTNIISQFPLSLSILCALCYVCVCACVYFLRGDDDVDDFSDKNTFHKRERAKTALFS